jgi:uncharacterized protein YoxC
MILEIELGLIVLAGVAVATAAVPLLLCLRRIAKEGEQLSHQINERLPLLLRLARETIHTANAAALDVRQGIGGVRQLGDAVGQIARSINQAQLAIRHGTEEVARTVTHTIQGWINGFPPAWHAAKNRGIVFSRLHRPPSTRVLSDTLSESGSGLRSRWMGSRGERHL